MIEMQIIDDRGMHSYLINTQVAEHVQDDTIKRILNAFPSDVYVEFKD